MAVGGESFDREKPSQPPLPWVDNEDNQRARLGVLASITSIWDFAGGDLCVAMESCTNARRRGFPTDQSEATSEISRRDGGHFRDCDRWLAR